MRVYQPIKGTLLFYYEGWFVPSPSIGRCAPRPIRGYSQRQSSTRSL